MRGIDATPEQMAAAREFIEGQMNRAAPGMGEMVSQRYEDLVRLVAWYGAIRFQAAKKGIGTFEEPAPVREVHDASL